MAGGYGRKRDVLLQSAVVAGAYFTTYVIAQTVLQRGYSGTYRREFGIPILDRRDNADLCEGFRGRPPKRIATEKKKHFDDWIRTQFEYHGVSKKRISDIEIVKPHPLRMGELFVCRRRRFQDLFSLIDIPSQSAAHDGYRLQICEDLVDLILLHLSSDPSTSAKKKLQPQSIRRATTTYGRHSSYAELQMQVTQRTLSRSMASRHAVRARWLISNRQGESREWIHDNALEIVSFAIAHEAAHILRNDLIAYVEHNPLKEGAIPSTSFEVIDFAQIVVAAGIGLASSLLRARLSFTTLIVVGAGVASALAFHSYKKDCEFQADYYAGKCVPESQSIPTLKSAGLFYFTMRDEAMKHVSPSYKRDCSNYMKRHFVFGVHPSHEERARALAH